MEQQISGIQIGDKRVDFTEPQSGQPQDHLAASSGQDVHGSQGRTAWIALSERLPDADVVVDTKIDDEQGARNEQPLKRRGNLWFVEDGSMYVYYSPTHWRPTDPVALAQRLQARLDRMDSDRAKVLAELGAVAAAKEQQS